MILKIMQIAKVQMGYSFRSRLDSIENGNLSVIQMKDLSQNNIIDCSNLVKINIDSLKSHHLMKKGDLVFRSRGQIISSALLIEHIENAIVAAPLLKIRIIKEKLIIPEYLNWYISQPEAQTFLRSRHEGTHGGMISKQALDELSVYIPSINKQKLIVELDNLSRRESVLLTLIAEKRKIYIELLSMDIAKGEIA